MDHSTLKALQAALEVTPENTLLRLTVVRGAVGLGERDVALQGLAVAETTQGKSN